MTWDTDSVLDRIRLKSQLAGWRALSILLLCTLAFLFGSQGKIGNFQPKKEPQVARVSIEGMIEDDQERLQKLKDIAADENIKAVILYLNTPGGTVVGGESLYVSVAKIREKKPVVAVMGDMATSAGYLVAVASDHIIARNGTLTGSIGVLLQAPEFTELAMKMGVKVDLIKSAPLKGTPSPFEKLTPEAQASAQALINSFYNIFVDIVAKERKMTREQMLPLADGRVYTGTQALEVKLIDGIGGEQEAIDWLVKVRKVPEKLKIKDYDLYPKPSKFEEIIQELGLAAKIAPLERISLQGLLSIW